MKFEVRSSIFEVRSSSFENRKLEVGSLVILRGMDTAALRIWEVIPNSSDFGNELDKP